MAVPPAMQLSSQNMDGAIALCEARRTAQHPGILNTAESPVTAGWQSGLQLSYMMRLMHFCALSSDHRALCPRRQSP